MFGAPFLNSEMKQRLKKLVSYSHERRSHRTKRMWDRVFQWNVVRDILYSNNLKIFDAGVPDLDDSGCV